MIEDLPRLVDGVHHALRMGNCRVTEVDGLVGTIFLLDEVEAACLTSLTRIGDGVLANILNPTILIFGGAASELPLLVVTLPFLVQSTARPEHEVADTDFVLDQRLKNGFETEEVNTIPLEEPEVGWEFAIPLTRHRHVSRQVVCCDIEGFGEDDRRRSRIRTVDELPLTLFNELLQFARRDLMGEVVDIIGVAHAR